MEAKSKRLLEIANMVKPDSNVYDVGADHGLLEFNLVSRNENIKIVAVENKIGPFKILQKNVSGLKNVRTCYRSGLASMKDNHDTLILAGMGGENIINILAEHPDRVVKVKNIIADAHRDIEKVRHEIVNYGFCIAKEKIVYENKKFYDIILFAKVDSKVTYKDDEYKFGYKIFEDPLWPNYRDFLIENIDKEAQKIVNVPSMKDKYDELIETKKRLIKYGKD